MKLLDFPMAKRHGLACLITLLTSAAIPLNGIAAVNDDLTSLSLEELMNIEVTSVSKKSQKLSEAAAAIYVINQEDIRRSSADSIPELLRMVPGLHVAQIDANKWAISSRGFNDRFSNKLLVLLDGRTLYTPLFSGVYWNAQDTMLADIERIEVIRGPGGTLWGANAVNGVINIISKHASDTHGGLVSVDAGSQGEGISARYGEQLNDKSHFRVYAKGFNRDDFKTSDDQDAHDRWRKQQVGFRFDLAPSTQDSVTVQGDAYSGNASETIGQTSLNPLANSTLDDHIKLAGSNILLRWNRQRDNGSEWTLQSYIDHTSRDETTLDFDIDIFDIDFQYRFSATANHDITWGAGYRRVEDDLRNSFTVTFTPDNRSTDLFNAFIQDEISINDDLILTVGTKFENNDYSGDEWQPSARLLWQLDEKHSLWTAVSRAIRAPSRSYSDLRLNVVAIPGFPPTFTPSLVSIQGNPDFEAENLLAFELGYRGRPSESLSLDISAFYNQYDDLITLQANPFSIEASPPPAHFLISSIYENDLSADSYGFEIASTWQAMPDWRLHAGYSWHRIDAHISSSSNDTSAETELEDNTPDTSYSFVHNTNSHITSNLMPCFTIQAG